MTLIVVKSQDGQSVQMQDYVALAKGMIGPTDLANGGQLSPQAANKLITMIFDDPFLKKVETVRMDRLTRNVDVIDLMRRALVRIPQGQEPTEAQMPGGSEHGCVLKALDAQLFPTLTLDFLRANKDNPNLVSSVEAGFVTRFQNDFVDLGFNGIADDNTGANQAEKFTRLNKGWVQIAKDSTATKKLAGGIDPATDGWVNTLQSIKKASDPMYRAQSVFIMNTDDADDYWLELTKKVTGSAKEEEMPKNKFSGITIEPHPLMPKGTVLFTPLKNLVFGLHTTIQQDKEYHKRRRALEYTFDQACDYEIAVKQACVLAEAVAA